MRRNARAGYLLAAPAILGFLIFTMVPMVASFVLSFTDYQIINTPSFVGWRNYRELFDGTDSLFFKSLKATNYFVFLSVPLNTIFAFMLASLLNRPIRARGFFRAIYYIPSVVPVVAVTTIWMWLLNPDLGLINVTLRKIGLPTNKWIFSEPTVIPSLALMDLWATGNIVVIYLSGLQGVGTHYYEAVEVDGGNAWHKFWNITVPMMTPTIFFNVIMGFINGFQSFAQAFMMTQGGPNNASLFYMFYLYREAFTFSKMGRACAIAWILFLIIGVLTAVIFRTSKYWVFYEGSDER
ncbi:MAG: sugar ABC transporter permease [Clostridia bacterium]|nr:sugar ABC transporter permease [Clostridia bacterium]